jgi:acetyl-CoA carboxylase carboxyl transferase subunit beta
VISIDPLGFTDNKPYTERLSQATESSGLPEAIISGRGIGRRSSGAGRGDGHDVSSAVRWAQRSGEKVTRLIERAMKEHSAVVIFSASGGARMQEGTLSLMQMAKISAALAALDEAHLPVHFRC